MTKKPRGKPVLMEREKPMRRRGQRPHKNVVKDEFRNCANPGCPNIVSIQDRTLTEQVKIYCALHRSS
jgi:hypothetical protein